MAMGERIKGPVQCSRALFSLVSRRPSSSLGTFQTLWPVKLSGQSSSLLYLVGRFSTLLWSCSCALLIGVEQLIDPSCFFKEHACSPTPHLTPIVSEC